MGPLLFGPSSRQSSPVGHTPAFVGPERAYVSTQARTGTVYGGACCNLCLFLLSLTWKLT